MDQTKELDRHLAEKQAEEFLSLLEELPPISLSRNDPCSCGSGKKYKKCCMEKDRASLPQLKTQPISFHVKMEPLTPEEAKNNFSCPSDEDLKQLNALHHTLSCHPKLIDSEECDYFQQLNALRLKYPNNPTILNYITGGYGELDLREKVEQLILETHEQFPDYLFAKTAMGNLYLKNGFPEKALEVFNGAYTLKKLYPNRDVFHISEVSAFEYFLVRYFCVIDCPKLAEVHLQIMEKVLEEDDPTLQDAQKTFRNCKAIHGFKAHLARFLKSPLE